MEYLPTLFGYPLLAASAALIVVVASDRQSLLGRHTVPGALDDHQFRPRRNRLESRSHLFDGSKGIARAMHK